MNNNLEYCEGFLKTNNDFYFHGFNLNVAGHVEDYTALSHPHAFGTGYKEYYGVLIDNDFICENNLEFLVDGALNILNYLFNRKKFNRRKSKKSHCVQKNLLSLLSVF